MTKLNLKEAEFYRELYKKVRPSVEKMVNSAYKTFTKEQDSVVEDILQEGMILFLQKYPQEKAAGKAENPAGFYYTICRNAYFTQLRAENKIPKDYLSDFEKEIEDGTLAEMEADILHINKAKLLHYCIEKMNERHQQLIKLRFWQEPMPSIEEVAKILGYAKRTAESTISRCYEALRDCITKKLAHI